MKTNFFIIISFLSITFIFCSTVCPIQYKCLNETDPLCFKETTKESVIIREERKCPKGQYCKKKSETESECSTNERNLFPGEACSSNNECTSNKCGNLTCTGLSEKSKYTSNAFCALGFYCSKGKFTKQIEINSETKCTSDFDCVNTAGCFKGVCTKYLTLSVGTTLESKDQSYLCETMYAFSKDGKDYFCANTTMTSPYLECDDEHDLCEYTLHSPDKEDETVTQKCECSWSDPTKRYCPMGSMNQTFLNATYILQRALMKSISKKNTEQRFTFDSFNEKKKFYYAVTAVTFPQYLEAPDCVYDYVLSSSYIKFNVYALLALALLV